MTPLRRVRLTLLALVILLSVASASRAQTSQGLPAGQWSVMASNYYFGPLYRFPDSAAVQVLNAGNAPITIDGSIVGNGFAIAGPSQLTIAAQSAASIILKYDSAAYPTAEAILQLTDGTLKVDVGLHGGVIPPLDGPLEFRGLEFGIIEYKDITCPSVSIKNRGTDPLTIQRLTIGGGASSNFSFYNEAPYLPVVLKPEGMLYKTICFAQPNPDGRHVADRLVVQYEVNNVQFTTSVPIGAGSIRCVELEDTLVLGSVRSDRYLGLDEFDIDSVRIYNREGLTRTIAKVEVPRWNSFSVLNTFPLAVPARDSAFVRFRFDARSSSMQRAMLALVVDDCGEQALDLLGHYAIKLIGDRSKDLRFDGRRDLNDTLTYSFYNDRTEPIRVLSASLAQHRGGAYARWVAPVTLDSGEVLNIRIEFGTREYVVEDTLIIETDAGLLLFPIHATIEGASGVRQSTSAIGIAISPNPGRGKFHITVSGGRATSIEVLDLLGRIVQQVDVTEARWEASASDAGSYFIRVTGISDDGTPFIRTSRVVKE